MSKQNFTAPGAPAPAIRPIETRYKGYRFRSRLEARWAVFFDALELNWEYEPEGYDLGFGQLYLPDFLVRAADGDSHWVEVKGVKPTADEDRKLKTLCSMTGRQGCFLVGAPGTDQLDGGRAPFALFNRTHVALEIGDKRNCSELGARGDVRCVMDIGSDRISFDHEGDRYYLDSLHEARAQSNRVATAVAKARSARFEHGECGA